MWYSPTEALLPDISGGLRHGGKNVNNGEPFLLRDLGIKFQLSSSDTKSGCFQSQSLLNVKDFDECAKSVATRSQPDSTKAPQDEAQRDGSDIRILAYDHSSLIGTWTSVAFCQIFVLPDVSLTAAGVRVLTQFNLQDAVSRELITVIIKMYSSRFASGMRKG